MIWEKINDGLYSGTCNGWQVDKVMVKKQGREAFKYVAVKDGDRVSGSWNLIKKVITNTRQLKMFEL